MRDLISRQAAIAEIARWIGYIDEDMIGRIQIGLKKLPSAQPESHDKRTETHACDLISRQRAIDAFDCTDELIVSGEANAQNVAGYINKVIGKIEALPPAQPKPCEDAVSRADVLECFADLYDTFEDCSKGIINELHRKFEDLRTLPSAQSDRSLWFRIGEICVDESKGFISAGRAVEKIRELLREAERREDG